MNSITNQWSDIGNQQAICQVSATWESHFIYVKNWTAHLPVEEIKSNIILLHDIGHYGESFSNFINWIKAKNKNIAIYTIDCIGHGLSTGTRGHVDEFETYISDLLRAFKNINFHNREVFVLGHGMGGLMAIDLYNRYSHHLNFKLQGLILTSFIMKYDQFLLNANWSKMLANGFFKRLKINNFFEPNLLTNFQEAGIAFAQDPLVVHRPSLGLVRELKEKSLSIYQDAYYLDVPIFVAWSENDHYLNKLGMNYFVKGVKKELLFEKKYSLMRHDLYNERDSLTFFEDLLNWILKHE